MIQFPNLFYKLVYRDFFERFVGSALGFLWAILNPLVLMGMYVLLFSVILKVRLTDNGNHIDFGLYLFCGMIPWLSFQETLVKASHVVLSYRHLIQQIQFPMSFLPLHVAFSALIQEIIAIFLFTLFVVQYQGVQFEGLFYLLLIVPIKFLFSCGFAFTVSALTVLYRDLVQLLNILLMIWFFATPIVYSVQMVPKDFRYLLDYNPFTAYVELYRFAILNQGSWSWGTYLLCLSIAILLFLVGRVLYLQKSRRFYLYL